MPLPLDTTVHWTEQVGVAYWPAGLQGIVEAELRTPLVRAPGVVWQDSAISLIGHAEITPAFPRVGAMLRIAPIAVWDATLRVYGTYYFGDFSAVTPFDDPDTAATAEVKQAHADERVPGWDLREDLDTRLKLKGGPFIVIAEVEARHHDTTTASGPPPYLWDPTEMLLIPGTDAWVLHRHLFLMEEFVPKQLYVGMYGVWSTSYGTGDENLRLGPLVMAKPGPRWPMVYAGLQPWIESRFIETLPGYAFFAVNWSR